MEISRTLGCDKLKKAYLLSLCLCAQKTLAETTTAEEAVQEKAFIGQVLDAITKPSAEHMSTYLGLGLALAIVAGIVLIALGGSKKENQIKFSLEDSLKEDQEREEAAKKKPKKAKEDEDWSDEGGLDKDDLYKDLDQKGPFLRTDQGTLDPESLLKLRRIIIRHAALAFKDRKDELFEERIEHLKERKYNHYKENLEITGEEFNDIMFEATKTAAEFLDIDEATYEASIKECIKDSDNAEEFQEDEEQVRLDVDTEGQEVLSRERTKELIIERIQMDFESEKKLSQLNPMSREESEQFVHYARQEVLDQIYIKHGIKFTAFNRAMKEYDFDDDEDIKAQETLVMVNREQMKKNQENEYKQQMQLTPEQNKELKEMCEAAVAVNGEPEINGLMAFEEYLKLFKIIVTLQCRYTIQNSEANKAARRAAMAQSDNNAFIQVTKKQLDQTNKTKNGVHLGVLEFFKIEPHLYDRTGEAVCENEEYDRRSTETMTKLEIAEHKRIVAQDESYVELDRATVLKHLDKLEEKKAQNLAPIYVQCELGQFPPSHIPMANEMARIQALDAYFNECGVTDMQISIAFKTHNLAFDDEFGAIVQKHSQIIGNAVDAACDAAGIPRPSERGGDSDEDMPMYYEEEDGPDLGDAY